MAKLADIDDATLVKLFMALRDRRAQRKTDYDLADADDKDKQNKIEVEFLRRFNDRGIDSVSARGMGTAYRSVRSSATVADWEALLGFIMKNEAWEMLERRVNKKSVEQFREQTEDLPPGVNWSETQVVNFRKS